MQINRLFEITYILMNKKFVTAKELAQRFEVSTRTIYRDIETLSIAGVPVYTAKGKGGGIGIMPEFVLDKSILNEQEQNEILLALQGISAVKKPEDKNVLDKLSLMFNKDVSNWIEVDFSDWGWQDNKYFENLKNAILENLIIEFDYFASNGIKTKRRAAPVKLWFKHRAWYIICFCFEKQDFRTFKLTRLKNLIVTTDNFLPKSIPEKKADSTEDNNPVNLLNVTLKFSPDIVYRIYDEFEEWQINKNDDGSFIVNVTWPDGGWVYSFILSFGEYVEVLEPPCVKEKIINILKNSYEKYL